MFKTFSFAFIFLALVSCGKSGGGGSGSGGDAVTLEEIESGVVPSAALNFNVNVKIDSSFTGSQVDKLETAESLIEKVISSEEFKDRVLNFKHNGKKGFVDNKGLSNAQIYKKIIEGSETLTPGVDNEMDLSVDVFRANSITVGYTVPSQLKIWMNSKYLNANKPYKVTTNMVHEWLHKMGFHHSKARTATRKYSVPYAIGYMVANLAKKYD
jgi:hypothetical protein